MKLKTLAKAVAIKSKRKLSSKGFRGISKAYVSLFLAATLVLGSTVAWFTLKDTAKIESQTFSLDAASGLRTNDGKDVIKTIKIPTIKLEEASSVDGRNIFFPTTFSDDGSTSKMTFREANAGDRNKRYIYADIPLAGDSTITNVYVKSYKIKIGDNVYQDYIDVRDTNNDGKLDLQVFNESCPVRVAFIIDSKTEPIIIDPSARVKNYAESTNAVEYIDKSGDPHLKLKEPDSFSSYYYGTDNPIVSIPGGTNVNLTMVAWLEGTCDNVDQFVGKDLTVDVEVESNITGMEYVYFVDNTVGDTDASSTHWVSSDDGGAIIAMQYKDPNASQTGTDVYKTTIMTKTDVDYTWRAAIPKAVSSDISFYRLSPYGDDSANVKTGTVYNSWHTSLNISSQLSDDAKNWIKNNTSFTSLQNDRYTDSTKTATYNTYTALWGNGYGYVNHTAGDKYFKWLSPCVGFWGYTGSGGGGTGGGTGGTGGEVIEGDITAHVEIEIPDNLSISSWYRNDLSDSGNYYLYAWFSYDGNTYKVKMTYDNGKCTLSQKVKSGTQLVGFQPFNKHDNTSKDYVKITPYTFNSNYNKSYRLTSQTTADTI